MKYLIITILLCGCSAQWHLKKALKKDPSIITTTLDTIVITEPIKYIDTFTLFKIDTFTFDTGGVKTVIYRYYDTFRFKQFIKGDTVKIVKNTVKQVVKKEKVKFEFYFALIVVGLLLGFLLKK
jgi:hypothetical protein